MATAFESFRVALNAHEMRDYLRDLIRPSSASVILNGIDHELISVVLGVADVFLALSLEG